MSGKKGGGLGGALLGAGGLADAVAIGDEADAAARGLKSEAKLRREQAKEQARQAGITVDINKKRGDVIFGEQVSAFAKSGVELSGSPLLVLANTKDTIDRENAEIQRRARIEGELLINSAFDLEAQARKAKDAGRIGQIGSVLSAGAQIALIGT